MSQQRRASQTAASSWSGLELRHLAAFVAVAEQRSFARAARSLGYTSPAVSQQLAQLEQIVGDRLVARTSGSSLVELTDAGELFLEHARRALSQFDAARVDLAMLHDTHPGLVRVGAAPTVAHRLLPSIFRRFSGRDRQPPAPLGHRVMRVVEAATPTEIAAALESGEADVALTGVPLPPGPFEARTLLLDAYVLAVPATHELASRQRVRADELDGIRLAGLKHSPPELAAFLRSHAPRALVGFNTDDYPHLLQAVDAGITLAIVPMLVIDQRPPGVVLIELDPVPPPRRIMLVRHADRAPRPVTEEFVAAAEQVARELREGVPAIRVA